MRLLWVTAEPPDRNASGGSIRQANLIEIVGRVLSVDLLMIGSLLDARVLDAVKNVVELRAPSPPRELGPLFGRAQGLFQTEILRQTAPVADNAAQRRTLADWLSHHSQDYDLVHLEHDRLAGLLPMNRASPWTITLHNLVSTQMRHRISEGRPNGAKAWHLQRSLAVATRFEARINRDFDHIYVTSSEDAAALDWRGVTVVPNGVDLSLFEPSPLPECPRLVFTGRLDWQPNVDGIVGFCRDVLPLIQGAVPRACLDIVGMSPVGAVRRLATLPGVAVHGDVPSVLPYLRDARVALVPLTIGSGTRLKALEAMASGRPVVGTTIGLADLGLVSGVNSEIADDSESMAVACIRLLRDDDAAAETAAAARTHVERRFGWEPIGQAFLNSLHAVAKRFGHARA